MDSRPAHLPARDQRGVWFLPFRDAFFVQATEHYESKYWWQPENWLRIEKGSRGFTVRHLDRFDSRLCDCVSAMAFFDQQIIRHQQRHGDISSVADDGPETTRGLSQ